MNSLMQEDVTVEAEHLLACPAHIHIFISSCFSEGFLTAVALLGRILFGWYFAKMLQWKEMSVGTCKVRCSDQHEATHPTLCWQVTVLGSALWAVVTMGVEWRKVIQMTHAEGWLGISINLVREANLDEGVIHLRRGGRRLQVFIDELFQVEVID